MTIQVSTPDGGTAEFPDGTSPDVMRNALRAKFGGGAKSVAKDMGSDDDKFRTPEQQAAREAIKIGTQAVKNLPSSAANFVKDVAQPFIHPIDTAKSIGNIGKGVMQKLGIMEGKDAEPYADAVGNMLVSRYGSGEAIKKTIATDPVGIAADIATVLGAPELALGKVPGAVGEASKAVASVGRAVDPLSIAGNAAKGAGNLAAHGLGVTTGAGSDAIKIAAQSGAEGGEAGKAFRDAMSGAESQDTIVESAKAAVSNLRKERGDIYRKEKAAVDADNTVLDFSKIDKAVNDAQGIKTFSGRLKTGPVQNLSPKTEGIRKEMTDAVEAWKNLDPKEFHTAEGIDALKQQIGDIRDATQYGTPDRLVADKIYNSVKQTIVDQVPDYAKVMKGYEEASAQIKEIERTLSVNPKASIDTALRKITSALRDNVNTNYGKRKELVAFLARSGAKHLLERIAGRSLAAVAPRGLASAVAGTEGISAITAIAAGHPAAAAALTAGLGLSSPAIVGGLSHGVGAATRLPIRRTLQGSRLIGANQ